MARVAVLNVKDCKYYETNCDSLDDFYAHLDADVFDIAYRKIGNVWYDIYVDDLGLCKDNPIVSAVSAEDYSPQLVGNLIFAHHDDEGETTDIYDDDMINIFKHLIIGVDAEGNMRIAVKLS